MSREESSTSNKQYWQTFAGAFRTRVREDFPDAIERKLEKGPNAGKIIHEREVKALFGIIENIALEDSSYGKRLVLTLDQNEDGQNPILSFGVESKDGRDVLKKLPAVDFSKEVRIMPYRFTPDDKPDEISGISISQPDEEGKFTVKVENFFFSPAEKDEEGKVTKEAEYLHGFPTIDWDNASESEKKIYKIQRDEFLVKYVEEHVIKGFQKKPDDFEENEKGFRDPKPDDFSDLDAEDVGF